MSATESIKYYVLSMMGNIKKSHTTNCNLQLTTSKKGFTLIELMVTIAIIAIISTVGLISYSKAQSLGRDAKRKQDLASIAIAQELYYQKNKTSAPAIYNGLPRDYNTGLEGCVSNLLYTDLEPNYINKLPEDPKNTGFGSQWPSDSNWCYFYVKGAVDNRRTITLFARLENPPPSTDLSRCTQAQLDLKPGTSYMQYFNYCLSP